VGGKQSNNLLTAWAVDFQTPACKLNFLFFLPMLPKKKKKREKSCCPLVFQFLQITQY
jgi:hypothetical protein